ncbi:hypothetical protein JB92DRAFT_2831784 [Gautieria morchelliformis]|nr:hypothetical protein JB92DRAFT_2831784 [Gautieria morchelliformis]
MNVHNRVHHLECYITGALMLIFQIITKIYILVTHLQDHLAQPVTQITAIHNVILPMPTQFPTFERHLTSLALKANTSHLTAVLHQILNTATNNQIVAFMDRVVELLNAELQIPGCDGTYYPDYHQLRATILNDQVYTGDFKEGLAVWLRTS